MKSGWANHIELHAAPDYGEHLTASVFCQHLCHQDKGNFGSHAETQMGRLMHDVDDFDGKSVDDGVKLVDIAGLRFF